MSKGIDSVFVHTGVSKSDLRIMEDLAAEHQLDFDWIQDEILKPLAALRAKEQELDDRSVEKVFEKALNQLERYK